MIYYKSFYLCKLFCIDFLDFFDNLWEYRRTKYFLTVKNVNTMRITLKFSVEISLFQHNLNWLQLLIIFQQKWSYFQLKWHLLHLKWAPLRITLACVYDDYIVFIDRFVENVSPSYCFNLRLTLRNIYLENWFMWCITL